MATLERAIGIAAEAHAGQLDKTGAPYIAHPMRLMARFLAGGNEESAIIAALHDVVQDSKWTLHDLHREGFSQEILSALEALTRRDGEEYVDYIRRAAAHPLARFVKEADIRDNLAEERMNKVYDRERLFNKYSAGLRVIAETPLKR
ncbi:HD domain-containing protein [Bosea sp. 2YAB26]|uniref:HD domain-containing protein n=1 Tax=Bosea sp. 2YAB26 TaxID=3237478 RepID=UPI003F917161